MEQHHFSGINALLGGIGGGQKLRQVFVDREVGKMRSLDPDQRKAFANNNRWLSRDLNAYLREDEAAALKAQLEQQKALADIGKVQSEAFKNNTQGQGYGLDNSGKRQAAIEGVIQQAAMTGDPGQVLIGLNRLAKTGLITPEQYQQEAAIVQTMTPEELQKYAQGSALTNKEVAQYLYQTANNAADNAQSDKNSQRTYDASIHGTNTAADTADKNRIQQQEQFERKQAYDEYIAKNKPVGSFVDIEGYRRIEFADGSSMRSLGEDGQPIKVQQTGAMNSTIQNAILETDEKVSATRNAITNLKDALEYSKKAYDGVGAAQRANIRGLIGEDERATATTMLDNIVTGNALEMLKATFGGAPTEGERAILLQLQGSANLPRAQREAIYTRAIQMAEARLASSEQKAGQLRSGTYFSSQPQQGVPYANAGQQSQSTFNLFD
ncbi:hypothetical protein [Acinetobacter indicus]|uniref:hypothetical protein n=1 Tax=Acinetobacter indicus TaxID=756892 RepID=UPI00144415BE|nr:hypothetical protein [Acinetobacter indicus]